MRSFAEDTIVAPATVPGAGAISIIRISGPEALALTGKVVTLKHGRCEDAAPYTLHFGTVLQPDGSPLDDVLVSIFRAPHSYTGEDAAEISCHASSYIVSQLLTLLVGAGARLAEAGEFTKRAYFNGKMDLAQAESVADIIAAEDAAAHRIAFQQMRGGFSRELKEMRDQLLEMTALMELELDFSEEDVEFADRSRLTQLLDRVVDHVQTLASSYRLGNAIKNGIPVTIAGAANTGKSTLLNALLGEERALVSDIAGTTRDTIEETLRIGSSRFRFIDTAGIRQTDETVEKMGIARTIQKVGEAHIVLGVVDASLDEEALKQQIRDLVNITHFDQQTLVILYNKWDKLSGNKNVTLFNNFVLSLNNKIVTFPISAKSKDGLAALQNWLELYEKDKIASSEQHTMVTNLRHYEALVQARTSLLRVRSGLTSSCPTDLVAEDLREAIRALQSILGASTPDVESTLGLIFSRFCIGK